MPAPCLLLAINTAEFFLSHRVHLALGAKAAGWDVWVLCPPSEKVREIERLGLSVMTVDIGRKSMNPFNELTTIWRIGRAIREIRPDVFHGFTVKPVLYGTLACRFLGIKVIVNTITGLGHLFISGSFRMRAARAVVGVMYRILFASPAVRVIFQNEDDWSFFIRRKWAVAERATVIKGTGVDLQRFSPSKEPPGVPVVVFPARLLLDKGIREMVGAAEILRKRGCSMVLELCGREDAGNPSALSKDEMDRLRERSDLFNLRGHVEDMAEIFKRCHIVCLPSYREGIPLALIEASASGRPIITTDVAGCREVVKDGVEGLLIPAGDAEKLADALERLLSSKPLREKMGGAARQRAIREFAMELVVRKNLQMYGAAPSRAATMVAS